MDDFHELLQKGFILYQKSGRIGVESPPPNFWECDLAFSRW